VRTRGSILPVVLIALALLFVAGPLALMGQTSLRALRVGLAERQAEDLAAYALAVAQREGAGQEGRLAVRCPEDGGAWRFRSFEVDGRPLGEYAYLQLRSRRGVSEWCVAGRTVGGPLNHGERVEVRYRASVDSSGRLLRWEVVP